MGLCGAVITDWGGSNDHCAGAKTVSALPQRVVYERRIHVEEILNLLPGQKKMFKQNKMPENSPERETLYKAHHHLARRACAESVVLKKFKK